MTRNRGGDTITQEVAEKALLQPEATEGYLYRYNMLRFLVKRAQARALQWAWEHMKNFGPSDRQVRDYYEEGMRALREGPPAATSAPPTPPAVAPGTRIVGIKR